MTTAAPNTQLKEKDFQKQVTKLAKELGWKVFHVSESRKSNKAGKFVPDPGIAGFPDLVLVRERVIFAELKREKGKATEKQKEVLNALEAAGAEVYLWRPSDIDEIEQCLTREWHALIGWSA